MSDGDASRNLLLGILALQNNFIDRHALIAAFDHWVGDKSRSLAEILVEQDALAPAHRELLDALVAAHVKLHDGETEKSLAAVSSLGSLRHHLAQVADPDVHELLTLVSSAAGGADATQPPATGAGTSTGTRFRILRLHARGGLGEVYVAEDGELHREVALKEIQECHADDPASRSRFVLEAEITGSLEHPGIVPVYGLGTYADGRPFYAMRFIKGDSLKEAIEQFHGKRTARSAQRGAKETTSTDGTPKPQSAIHDPQLFNSSAFRKLLARFIDVCNAIEYAHSRGVLHRDLKPGNVMLGKYGETLVVDWGLAKPAGRSEAHRTASDERTLHPQSVSGSAPTQMGCAFGTPEYMSPEQAEGRLDLLGPATDVYSLGATLYTIATGGPPIGRGELADTLCKVANGDFPPPRQVQPGVPRALEAICLRAMARRPGDRYASARALADDVEHWLADEPVSALPETTLERVGRWCRRHRTWVRAGVAAAIVVAVTASVAFTFVRRSRDDALVAAANERDAKDKAIELANTNKQLANAASAAGNQANSERAKADAARRLAETTLADMYTAAGLTAGDQNKPAEAALWFAAAAEATTDPHRRWANRVRQQTYGEQAFRPVAAFQHPDRIQHSLEFHPGSRFLFAVSTAHHCQIWDVQEDKPVDLPDGERPVSAAAWSPDGDELALGSPEGTIDLYSFPAGERLRHLDCHGTIEALRYSADGRYLAYAGENARVWNCRSNEFATPELPHPGQVLALSFSVAGNRLATACGDWKARVFAISAGASAERPIFEPLSHMDPYFARFRENVHVPPPFAPEFVDSDRGLIVTDMQSAHWHDAETGLRLRSMVHQTPPTVIAALGISPDRSQIAVGGWRGKSGVVYVWTPLRSSTPAVRGTTTNQNGVRSIAFSADGAFLLAGAIDASARFWSADALAPVNPAIDHQSAIHLVAIAPVGRFFATAQEGGLVRAWSLPVEDSHAFDVQVAGAGSLFCLSADGRYLLPTGLTSWQHSPITETGVFEARRGSTTGLRLATGGGILNGAFAPNGQNVAIVSAAAKAVSERKRAMFAGSPAAGNLQLWDWRNGVRKLGPIGMPSEPRAVDFSPDGLTVAVICAAGEIVLVDVDSGMELRRLRHGDSHNAALEFRNNGTVRFSPDGRMLITCGLDDSARVWSVADGELRFSCKHEVVCHAAEISHDGCYLATAGYDNLARVWELASGNAIGAPLHHADWVFSARFSPDDGYLVTTSRDRNARIWDWQKGTLVCAPLRHDEEVYDVAISQDSRWVVSASLDNKVRVWDAQSGKPLAPPSLASDAPLTLGLSTGGGLVYAAGIGPSITAIALPEILRAELANDKELGLFAPLLAAARIEAGGIAKISNREWYDRWRGLRSGGFWDFKTIWSERSQGMWHRRQARIHEESGRWQAATWHLDRLIESEPEDLDVYARRALARLQCRQWRRAIGDYTRVIDAGAAQRFTHYRRALAELNTGEWQQAAVDLAREIEIEPTAPVLWQLRAQAEMMLRQWEKAGADLKQAGELGGDFLTVSHLSALCLVARGDPEAYRELCRTILARFAGVSDGNSANTVAWICVLGNEAVTDYSQVLAIAERAVASNPKLDAYRNTLGAVQCRAGRFQEAIATLARAIESDPASENPSDWLFLAFARAHLGDVATARSLMERSEQWLERADAAPDEVLVQGQSVTSTLRFELRCLLNEVKSLLSTQQP
jgi:WD40 repeat protein/serine/threonine protein kinase/tetratricopeptide (TPR) repeat protein